MRKRVCLGFSEEMLCLEEEKEGADQASRGYTPSPQPQFPETGGPEVLVSISNAASLGITWIGEEGRRETSIYGQRGTYSLSFNPCRSHRKWILS